VVKVTGLGKAEDGEVSATLENAFVNVEEFKVTGKLTGKIEKGFQVGSDKVTVGLNKGAVSGEVDKNTLGAVSVTELDIDVTINNKPPLKLGGKLSGSYNGTTNKVVEASLTLDVRDHDLEIPVGDDQDDKVVSRWAPAAARRWPIRA
jgi:hypothetical protein